MFILLNLIMSISAIIIQRAYFYEVFSLPYQIFKFLGQINKFFRLRFPNREIENSNNVFLHRSNFHKRKFVAETPLDVMTVWGTNEKIWDKKEGTYALLDELSAF